VTRCQEHILSSCLLSRKAPRPPRHNPHPPQPYQPTNPTHNTNPQPQTHPTTHQPTTHQPRFARTEYLRLAVEDEPDEMQVDSGDDAWPGVGAAGDAAAMDTAAGGP